MDFPSNKLALFTANVFGFTSRFCDRLERIKGHGRRL